MESLAQEILRYGRMHLNNHEILNLTCEKLIFPHIKFMARVTKHAMHLLYGKIAERVSKVGDDEWKRSDN